MSVVSLEEFKNRILNNTQKKEHTVQDFLLFCRHGMDQFDYTELLEAYFLKSTYDSLDEDMRYLCDQLKEMFHK